MCSPKMLSKIAILVFAIGLAVADDSCAARKAAVGLGGLLGELRSQMQVGIGNTCPVESLAQLCNKGKTELKTLMESSEKRHKQLSDDLESLYEKAITTVGKGCQQLKANICTKQRELRQTLRNCSVHFAQRSHDLETQGLGLLEKIGDRLGAQSVKVCGQVRDALTEAKRFREQESCRLCSFLNETRNQLDCKARELVEAGVKASDDLHASVGQLAEEAKCAAEKWAKQSRDQLKTLREKVSKCDNKLKTCSGSEERKALSSALEVLSGELKDRKQELCQKASKRAEELHSMGKALKMRAQNACQSVRQCLEANAKQLCETADQCVAQVDDAVHSGQQEVEVNVIYGNRNNSNEESDEE